MDRRDETMGEDGEGPGITLAGDPVGGDPFALFSRWLEAAGESEINDPTAVALATVDETGLPDVRMVLMKDHGPDGFVFYTNLQSDKGRQIEATAKAALCFHWKSLRRQVRVRGTLEPVSAPEADAYFASRSHQSRIGALASDQSRPLPGRAHLEERVAALTERLGEAGEVPRPEHWSGRRLKPVQIEFWQDGAHRLHDRAVFSRARLQEDWTIRRLYP